MGRNVNDDRGHKSDPFFSLPPEPTRAANLTQSVHIIPIFIYHKFPYKTATLISNIFMFLTFLKLFKYHSFSSLTVNLGHFLDNPSSCCCWPQTCFHYWYCLISPGMAHDPCNYVHTRVYTEAHIHTHVYASVLWSILPHIVHNT